MNDIKHTIKLSNYMDISIINPAFDDIDNAKVELDVTFSTELVNGGILLDVDVTDVRWSYTGVKFTDDENEEHEIDGSSEGEFAVEIIKERPYDGKNIGLLVNNVEIDLKTKSIRVHFEY